MTATMTRQRLAAGPPALTLAGSALVALAWLGLTLAVVPVVHAQHGEAGQDGEVGEDGQAAPDEAMIAQIDDALAAAAAVAPGDFRAYLTARDAVLAFGAAALPHLEARSAADQWTAQTWREAVVAAVCRDRLAGEEWVAEVERPFGLDRDNYMQFRRQIPVPSRDFIRIGARCVPHLMERYLWTFEEYPYSTENGAQERAVLLDALLFVPGRLEDARAVPFLASVAADVNVQGPWRGAAARSLGQAGGRATTQALLELLAEDGLALPARLGILRGLGHTYSVEALQVILRELRAATRDAADEQEAEELAAVRLACYSALGTIGNWLAWQRRFADEAELEAQIREAAATELAALMSTERTPYERQEITVALGAIAWEGSVEAMQELAENEELDAEQRQAAQLAESVLRRSVARRQAYLERQQD